MEAYIGYGFSTDDVSTSDLTGFIRKYSPDTIPELCCEVFGNDFRKIKSFDELDKDEMEEVADHIENGYPIGICEASEVISEAINKAEGTEILSYRGEYVVFESLRFADDEERAGIIRSKEDFIRLVSKYFPESEIVFGNVYDGSEMEDPDYHMD